MEDSEKNERYFKAKDRMEEIKKFYINLLSYIFFIAFLAAVNYYTNEWDYPWFLWAAFGWGIGIIFKAAKVFGINPFLGKNWEERKIKEFMHEDENQRRWK